MDKIKRLVDYQKANKYNETWIIKKAVFGKSYEEIFKNTLLDGFITILMGSQMLNEENKNGK